MDAVKGILFLSEECLMFRAMYMSSYSRDEVNNALFNSTTVISF